MSSAEDEAPRDLPLDGPELRRTLARSPSMLGQYLRAAGRGLFGTQGEVAPDRVLRRVVLERPGVVLDAELVARYRQVCGFAEGSQVPSVYLQTLFLGCMTEQAVSPEFPVSPFGLVHTVQRFTQHRELAPGTKLDLRCSLGAVRQVRRGVEIDLSMEARATADLVWEGSATVLSRDKKVRGRKGKAGGQAGEEDQGGWCEPVEVPVPADTGRRYALVSGDYNPFHLHALLARPFGFRRPIAHGMWTMARALAEVERGHDLPQAHSVSVAFKRPIFMPGQVLIRHRAELDLEGVEFQVRHARKDTPHLLGSLDLSRGRQETER